MTTRELLVDQERTTDGERLDVFLARSLPELTRSQVKRLTDGGNVLLNGSIPKASARLQPGDLVRLTIPPPRPVDLAPEPIPLNVLYEDEDMLVVDKPAGLTVHPAPGHPSGTLVNALLAIARDLKGIGGELRPGIVHRLDKDTSGLMVVAKGHLAHNSLTRQIKQREVRKGYLALARGHVRPAEGTIEAPVGRDPRNRKRMAVVPGGRQATTRYKVVRHLGRGEEVYTYLEVFPETGRTHQIRVHFASMGHPLAGDALYGPRRQTAAPFLARQFLHAHLLGFRHPASGDYVEFSSPLPAELFGVLEGLS